MKPIDHQLTVKQPRIRRQNDISKSAKTVALIVMCLAVFMTNLDGTVVDVALPQMQQQLGASMLGLQWILNAYTLPIASLLLVSGTVGDLYGRKRVFSGGLIVFTLASILCGIAPNLVILIVGRSLQGIGAAAMIPLSLTILTDTFPQSQEKTKAIGVWSAVSALALVVGPVLGGLLVDIYSWRSIFFLNLPLGIAALFLTEAYLPQTSVQRQPIDLPGLASSAVLLATLTYILTEGSAGWRSPFLLGLLGIAAVSAIAFFWAESRTPHPVIPLNLFHSTFLAIAIVPILVFFTCGSLFLIFSLFLQQVQAYSPTAVGWVFLPMNGAIITASLVSGWLATRWGWRFPVISGLVLASIATFALTRIDAGSEYGEIVFCLVGAGFGGGLTVAPLAAAAMNFAESSQEAVASAIFNISIHFGGILGIAVQGAIFNRRFGLELRRSLYAWNLPPDVQNQLIDQALQGSTEIDLLLPPESNQAFKQAFDQAFVSGLHLTVVVASGAMLAGVLLLLILGRRNQSKIITNDH